MIFELANLKGCMVWSSVVLQRLTTLGGILIDADPGNLVSYHSKSGLILMNEDWLASSSAARIIHISNVYCAYFGNGLGTFLPP